MSAQLKRRAAEASLRYIEDDMVLGVGTGSTVNQLIDLLDKRNIRLDAAVSSSEATTQRLIAIGVRVIDLNQAGSLDVYIDGADEFDRHRRLIKGGGGALTREKIIASASRKFVCIADANKRVDVLGQFPLPIEVIPMARSLVSRQLVGLGGQPVYREDFVTDNGNAIVDVHNLNIVDPVQLEQQINNMPGVVCCGLFALRGADLVLAADDAGVASL